VCLYPHGLTIIFSQPRTDPQLAHLLPLELKEYYGLFPSEAPKKFDMSATGPDPLKDPLAPGDLVIVWGLQGEEAEYNDRKYLRIES